MRWRGLLAGRIDVAMLWGPIGGPFARGASGARTRAAHPRGGAPAAGLSASPWRCGPTSSSGSDDQHRAAPARGRHQRVLIDYGVPLARRGGQGHPRRGPEAVSAAGWGSRSRFASSARPLRRSRPEPPGYRTENYPLADAGDPRGRDRRRSADAVALWSGKAAVFIDVMPQPPRPANLPAGTLWRHPPRESIPGAIWLPNVGFGALAPETEAYFRARPRGGDGGTIRTRPIVIFCMRDCWMSWNAAKRGAELWLHGRLLVLGRDRRVAGRRAGPRPGRAGAVALGQSPFDPHGTGSALCFCRSFTGEPDPLRLKSTPSARP